MPGDPRRHQLELRRLQPEDGALLQDQPGVVHGSKAVGEPPLMLAISVREAIRDAVAAFGPAGGEVQLNSPATSEAIFLAIQRRVAPHPDGMADDASWASRHQGADLGTPA